jgi:hypothetical protein
MKLFLTAKSILISNSPAVITVNRDFHWKSKKMTVFCAKLILRKMYKLIAYKDTLNLEVLNYLFYLISLDGFCFFGISNCIEYSKDKFDLNKNPLCQKCYTSNGRYYSIISSDIDENSPYIADYILASGKT